MNYMKITSFLEKVAMDRATIQEQGYAYCILSDVARKFNGKVMNKRFIDAVNKALEEKRHGSMFICYQNHWDGTFIGNIALHDKDNASCTSYLYSGKAIDDDRRLNYGKLVELINTEQDRITRRLNELDEVCNTDKINRIIAKCDKIKAMIEKEISWLPVAIRPYIDISCECGLYE